MFPRRTAIIRIVGAVSLIIFATWMWNMSTVDIQVTHHELASMWETSAAHNADQTRNVTHAAAVGKVNASVLLTVAQERIIAEQNQSLQSHHHDNQTLDKLMKNMTLLHVNKKALHSILQRVNESQSSPSAYVANPHPFQYVINSHFICHAKDIFVIVYIHTAPSHYKRRMVIRQTWGNPKYYPDYKIRLVFVMGVTDDKPEVQQALLFESEQYGDIVQEDFADTYRNLTYKGITALKWISTYCSHAKFVLKTDDDIFVNTFTLFRHLQSLSKFGVNDKGLIMCLVWSRMKVMRTGKWKVDVADFKDDYYPTYCSGSAFTLSMDVAVAMYNMSYHVPFFWVDDFYITGLLPMKLNYTHRQFMSTYVLDGRKLEEKFTGPQWFTYIFSHIHDLDAIQSVWARLVDLAKGNSKPTIKFALPGEVSNLEIEEERKQEEKRKAAELKKQEEKKKKEKH